MDLISSLRYAAAEAAQSGAEPPPAPAIHPDLIRAYSLAGRTAVVTGAGMGIGRQVAITFGKAGASVVIADVNAEAAKATAAAVEEVGASATVVLTDVSRKADIDALADAALAGSGRIDVWANVAGIIRESPITQVTEADVNAVVAVNQLGVYWGCAAAARAMIPAGKGSIINIASAGGELPAPTLSIYGMTKAAVISITRSVAAELGPHGIRANAVSPGFVETPMTERNFRYADGTIDEAKRQALLSTRAKVPLQRVGTPDDIAQCLLFLAADASSFVTGQVVRPNGGIVMA